MAKKKYYKKAHKNKTVGNSTAHARLNLHRK